MEKKPKKQEANEKSQLKSLMQFSGLAIQMGVIIFLGATLGKYLDKEYLKDSKIFTMIFTLMAVAISLWYTLRKLKQFNEK